MTQNLWEKKYMHGIKIERKQTNKKPLLFYQCLLVYQCRLITINQANHI